MDLEQHNRSGTIIARRPIVIKLGCCAEVQHASIGGKGSTDINSIAANLLIWEVINQQQVEIDPAQSVIVS